MIDLEWAVVSIRIFAKKFIAKISLENVFALLMDAVRCRSLGLITDALFEVCGRYRRNR